MPQNQGIVYLPYHTEKPQTPCKLLSEVYDIGSEGIYLQHWYYPTAITVPYNSSSAFNTGLSILPEDIIPLPTPFSTASAAAITFLSIPEPMRGRSSLACEGERYLTRCRSIISPSTLLSKISFDAATEAATADAALSLSIFSSSDCSLIATGDIIGIRPKVKNVSRSDLLT